MVRMVAMGDDWDDDGGGGSSSGPLPVAEVAFATAIFTSRAFALGPPGKGRHSYMLPLIDMGNHRANCTHALEAPEEWTPQSGKTLKLVAGADIKRGEEVRRGGQGGD